MLIQTDDGSIYTVDTINKVIVGGVFPQPVQYVSAMLIIGCQGCVYLPNGAMIPIGMVVGYC